MGVQTPTASSWPAEVEGSLQDFGKRGSLEKILILYASCVAESWFWGHLLFHCRALYFLLIKLSACFLPSSL